MIPIRTVAALLLAASLASACGSSGSSATPLTPSGTQLTVPTVFLQTSQKINATNNELSFKWTGSETTYQIVIGSSPGSSNFTTDVIGTTYTWISPQQGGAYYARVAAKRGDSTSGFSTELSLFVLDIRNVIDAMFFHAGPMADVPSTATSNPAANIWADGARLRVLVSGEAGETVRVNAQTFVDQYAAQVGGAVTATTEFTSETLRGTSYPALFPDFTIGVRIQPGFCGGALGCVPISNDFNGPAAKKAIVTLEQNNGLTVSATAHEVGHAYGLGHVTIPAAGRPEFRFMMSPAYVSEQMTDVEKLAIALAWQGGIRPGMRRSEAQQNRLVNPYTGASALSGVRAAIQRDAGDALGILSPTLVRSRSSTWRKFSGVQ